MLGTTTPVGSLLRFHCQSHKVETELIFKNTLHRSLVHNGKDLAFIEVHHGKSGTFCCFLNSYHQLLLQRLPS